MTRDLPSTLPIFPLTGALLLPGGTLPLNIFEPRYLRMVDAALSESRMIGMVQPRLAEEGLVADAAEIYSTGCAGRIVSFAESGDGRYLITLLGVHRFRIIEELPQMDLFRRVTADFDWFDDEETEQQLIDRTRLVEATRAFLSLRAISADWSAVDRASDQELVTSLAMSGPFEPSEKQGLLECAGLAEQSQMLISLMEMSVHEAEDTSRTQH